MRDTVLDLDRRHVLPAGDDHILPPVRDRQVAFIVDRAAVAGVEPPARQRFGGRLGVLPIAVQYDVRTDEHLSEVGDLHLYAECGCAGASQLACAYPGGECGVNRARPVERDDRRRLGQPIDLNELPAQFLVDALNHPRRRWRAGAHDPYASPARNVTVPRGGSVEYRVPHRWGSAHHRDAVFVDAAKNLGAVHLAQHHLLGTEPSQRVGQPPSVGVKHGKRVQVDVAFPEAKVHAEAHGIDPDVAVRDLDALGTSRRSRGVVDRGGRVLLRVRPCAGRDVEPHHVLVGDSDGTRADGLRQVSRPVLLLTVLGQRTPCGHSDITGGLLSGVRVPPSPPPRAATRVTSDGAHRLTEHRPPKERAEPADLRARVG